MYIDGNICIMKVAGCLPCDEEPIQQLSLATLNQMSVCYAPSRIFHHLETCFQYNYETLCADIVGREMQAPSHTMFTCNLVTMGFICMYFYYL